MNKLPNVCDWHGIAALELNGDVGVDAALSDTEYEDYLRRKLAQAEQDKLQLSAKLREREAHYKLFKKLYAEQIKGLEEQLELVKFSAGQRLGD